MGDTVFVTFDHWLDSCKGIKEFDLTVYEINYFDCAVYFF